MAGWLRKRTSRFQTIGSSCTDYSGNPSSPHALSFANSLIT